MTSRKFSFSTDETAGSPYAAKTKQELRAMMAICADHGATAEIAPSGTALDVRIPVLHRGSSLHSTVITRVHDYATLRAALEGVR